MSRDNHQAKETTEKERGKADFFTPRHRAFRVKGSQHGFSVGVRFSLFWNQDNPRLDSLKTQSSVCPGTSGPWETGSQKRDTDPFIRELPQHVSSTSEYLAGRIRLCSLQPQTNKTRRSSTCSEHRRSKGKLCELRSKLITFSLCYLRRSSLLQVEFRCSEHGLLLGKDLRSAVFTLGPRGAAVPGLGPLRGCRALTSSWYPPGDSVLPHNPPAES